MSLRRVLLFGAALVLLVLVIAQLILPGIATQDLRDRLAKSGRVLQVEIHAFPAIELLWNDADRVVVRMDTYTSVPGHLGLVTAVVVLKVREKLNVIQPVWLHYRVDAVEVLEAALDAVAHIGR